MGIENALPVIPTCPYITSAKADRPYEVASGGIPFPCHSRPSLSFPRRRESSQS